ncbi:hypothetical protein ACL03H_17035 [Saccharopolyspora sp. MS10]|uniref:hypothetical protein n=1 Tax=Saccharopolyspora sp. MS10 TaxID=3385973 RepID=UPI0039A0EE07
MAGVDDVRDGIARAKVKAEEALTAIQQAGLALDEAQSMLVEATQGSGQDEILQSRNMLVDATQNLQLVQGTVRNSISSAEGYAGRL